MTASVVLLAACHTTKKSTTNPIVNEPVIQLDTISVVANEPVKREIYRGSNPISNDILFTELNVRFDWNECKLYGKASMQVKPHFYPTDMLYLNARGMEIKTLEVYEEASVTEKKKVGNKEVEEKVDVWNTFTASTFKYENDSIKINLGRTFSSKETYYVEITYVAKPNELKKGGSDAITDDKGLYFINPKGENKYKMPQIWTQGETQSNSCWFPTIDSPNSKMLQEIYITVDDKYTTLSNGLLVDSKKDANGLRTDHWKLDLPSAPYLTMMAVGEFKKVVDEPWNGKEISYYVEKQYAPYAKEIFGDTKEMIEFYSTRLGVPYAWPKYAQVVARDYVSGAMENTSATLHGDFMVYQTSRDMLDGKKGNSVIAHELFHQWFGDLVTCESWSNIPLNESFATYGEYLWEEYKNGRDAADYHLLQSRKGYMDSEKEVNLIRFYYGDREDMFDRFSYNKGGQVLHMLRKALGDDAFFAGLKKYLETNKFKTVEIHNLRLAFEETTGQDLNWFFNQWFLDKGRPKLKITQTFNPSTHVIELSVEQNQDLKKCPLYTLPLTVDVYNKGDVERHRITVTDVKQTFFLTVSSAPQLVNFDAERQLLCDMDYSKTVSEYLFQYRNAPLYQDRLEALRKLENNLSDSAVFNLFRTAAIHDKFFALRNYALNALENAPQDKSLVKSIYTAVYNTDKNTRTRTEALRLLNKKFWDDADVKALDEKALHEPSYAICGEALKTIAKNAPEQAMEKAKLFEKESGKDVLFPMFDIYSSRGDEAQIPAFQNALTYLTGFEMASFCSMYGKLGKRCKTDAGVLIIANDLEMLGKGATVFTKYACLKGLKDLVSSLDGKEKTLTEQIDAAKKENKDVSVLERSLKSAGETKSSVSALYEGLK